jgi:hypothetical protein
MPVHEQHRTRTRDHGPHDQSAHWLAVLPRGAMPPYRVWVNGVEQEEGVDFVVTGRGLLFDRPLEKEGKIGLFRWALMFFGIAGTYRKNDSVDVQWEFGGSVRLATGLELKKVQ